MTKTKLIFILIIWQILIAFWVKMGVYIKPNPLNMGVVWQANFEAEDILSISERGYTDKDWKTFPMYPHLISILTRLTEDRVLSGILISLGGFGVALWYFVKLLKLDESEGVVWNILITFLLFPTSLFFASIYSEGLFLMWTMLTFYYARKKKWPLAGLFGLFASYTNFFGIFLWPAIFVEVWQNRKQKRDMFWILLIPFGTWFYASYVGLTSGDYLNFTSFKPGQIVMWYQIVWRYLKSLYLLDIVKIFELIVGILFAITALASFWKSRLSYAVFGFLIYLVPTLSGNFVSLPRYVLFSFVSFVLIGKWMQKHSLLKWFIWGFEFTLFGVFTMLFSRGYFVS